MLLRNFILILFLVTLKSGFAADISSEGQIVREDVKKILAAVYAGDVDTVLHYTHSKVLAILGGDAAARETLTATLTQLKAKGMAVESFSFPEEPTFIQTTRSEFVIVPTLTVIQAQGQRVESLNYQFGARPVHAKEWKYIEGSRINAENVRELFPDFPIVCKFPALYRRKLQE